MITVRNKRYLDIHIFRERDLYSIHIQGPFLYLTYVELDESNSTQSQYDISVIIQVIRK